MQPEKSVTPRDRSRTGAHRNRLPLSPILPAVLAVILAVSATWAPLRPASAAPQAQETVLAIGYPQQGSSLSGVVTIQGTATTANFRDYSLYYAAGTQVDGSTAWRYDDPITTGVPTMIVNGVLANWDTTKVPNGQYVLALAVWRTDSSDPQVAFVNNLTVYNEAPTPTPVPTATPDTEQPEPGEATPTGELPPPVGATIELPPTATPRPSPTLSSEPVGGSDDTGGDDEGGILSGDLFSVKAVKEAFSLGVQMAFLLYAIGLLYMLTKAVIRYYLRQTRSKSRS